MSRFIQVTDDFTRNPTPLVKPRLIIFLPQEDHSSRIWFDALKPMRYPPFDLVIDPIQDGELLKLSQGPAVQFVTKSRSDYSPDMLESPWPNNIVEWPFFKKSHRVPFE